MNSLKRWSLVLMAVSLIITPFTFYGQDSSDDGFRIKVLNYNLRFGELASLEELAEFIRNTNPDIVALQEVDVKTNRERAPHQNGKDFITELGYRTGLLSAYARTIDYSGGYYGIGILSKYPFEQTRKIMLPLPEGSKEQRALLLADVELPGNVQFTFVSTHLDHSSSSVRMVQVQAINEVLANNPHPLIIAGDFNARPESPEIEAGMNGYKQLCSNDYSVSADNPRFKIDYIFGKPAGRWTKLEAETPQIQLSDHLPLISVVNLK